MSAVIIYRYDASPYSHKIDNVLVLKRIPHDLVQVSPLLPRPEITELLGITYRRIPILAIGNDVYCDTSIIASALERRFPTARSYGTIFPKPRIGDKTDTGMIKAFSKYYGEALVPHAGSFIRWDQYSEAVIKDRSALRGVPINVEAITANTPVARSALSTHLSLLEEQLSDSREWLFDTEAPSLADISIHVILAWGRGFVGTETLFDPAHVPLTLQWLTRVSEFIKAAKESQQAPATVDGADAASRIVEASHEPYDVIGFDTIEADRLGVANGGTVEIAPEDTGRAYPTVGKLVALNREEFVLEVKGSKGLVRCHFPRLGFFVKPAAKL